MSIHEPWEFEYKRQKRAKRERAERADRLQEGDASEASAERPMWQILLGEVLQLTFRM